METEPTLLDQIWQAVIPLIFGENGLIAIITPIIIASMVAGRSAIVKLIMRKVEAIIIDTAQEFGTDQQKAISGKLPSQTAQIAKAKAMRRLEDKLTAEKGLAALSTKGMRSAAIEKAVNLRNKNEGLRSVDLTRPRGKGA